MIRSRRWIWLAILLLFPPLGCSGWWLCRTLHSHFQLSPAESALARGDEAAAARLALQALKASPSDPRASRIAALALLRSGELERARPHFDLAWNRGWMTDADLIEFSSAFLRNGLDDDAELLLRRGLAASPSNLELLKQLAGLLQLHHRNGEALALAVRLTQLKGGELFGHALLSMIHREEDRPGPSIDSALQVLALDPHLANAPVVPEVFWTDLTASLLDLGDPVRSVRLLQRELNRRSTRPDDPLLPALHEAMGRSCLALGDLDAADLAYRAAASLDPSRIRSLLGAGQVALRKNQPLQALDWLEKARQLDPSVPDTHYALAQAYRSLGRIHEANEALQRFRRQSQGRPQSGGMGFRPGRGSG